MRRGEAFMDRGLSVQQCGCGTLLAAACRRQAYPIRSRATVNSFLQAQNVVGQDVNVLVAQNYVGHGLVAVR